jgi:hypothetical protein
MTESEKEFIPLKFVQMNFDGSSVYERMDTGKKIAGKYVDILIPELGIANIPYGGIGKVRLETSLLPKLPALKNANGLILRIPGNVSNPRDLSRKNLKKDILHSGQYCYIDEKAAQKHEEDSGLGSGLSFE